MSALPEFIQKQYEFTRHCRDPENQPAPANIEERRMAIYRNLLYNNIEGFMANNFPVIRTILPDDQWHSLIRDYFANHKATTPLFPKLPTEFLQYLEQERDNEDDYPFLLELAHYEWVESSLMIDAREINLTGIDEQDNLLDGIPVINDLIWPLVYEYPVHKISPAFIPDHPDQKEQTFLVVVRDRNDEVSFMELNAVTARLLARMIEITDQSGRSHLQAIADEMQHPQPETVINGGLEILQQMQQRDIVLGTKTIS